MLEINNLLKSNGWKAKFTYFVQIKILSFPINLENSINFFYKNQFCILWTAKHFTQQQFFLFQKNPLKLVSNCVPFPKQPNKHHSFFKRKTVKLAKRQKFIFEWWIECLVKLKESLIIWTIFKCGFKIYFFKNIFKIYAHFQFLDYF